MKRLIALFCMLILSAQSVWAAASVYCMHEESPATWHFGHHQHDHVGGEADQKKPRKSILNMADGDCGLCHPVCVAVIHDVDTPSILPQGMRPQVSSPPASLPGKPIRPERPKWSLSA